MEKPLFYSLHRLEDMSDKAFAIVGMSPDELEGKNEAEIVQHIKDELPNMGKTDAPDEIYAKRITEDEAQSQFNEDLDNAKHRGDCGHLHICPACHWNDTKKECWHPVLDNLQSWAEDHSEEEIHIGLCEEHKNEIESKRGIFMFALSERPDEAKGPFHYLKTIKRMGMFSDAEVSIILNEDRRADAVMSISEESYGILAKAHQIFDEKLHGVFKDGGEIDYFTVLNAVADTMIDIDKLKRELVAFHVAGSYSQATKH